MCSDQLFIEVGREGNQNPSINSPYNKFFLLCHHFHIQYIIHSPTSSITVSLTPSTPFPNSNVILPSLPTLPYSSSHSPAPTILLTSSSRTYQSLSNSPHISNKCSTSSPTPLSHITHLSSIIILHHFLSSNNPAKVCPRSEQQPLNFLTLHRPQIHLHPCTILCQLIALI